jgi:putative membrane protein
VVPGPGDAPLDQAPGAPDLRNNAELAETTKVLAANQGLYNGLLVAGLVWDLVSELTDVKVFFLACVVVAGVYGAATVSSRILFVRAVSALLALGAVLVAS